MDPTGADGEPSVDFKIFDCICASSSNSAISLSIASFLSFQVSFTSPKAHCDISVSEVVATDDDVALGGPIKFSKEMSVYSDKYEIV